VPWTAVILQWLTWCRIWAPRELADDGWGDLAPGFRT
jgi:hypothetical protein